MRSTGYLPERQTRASPQRSAKSINNSQSLRLFLFQKKIVKDIASSARLLMLKRRRTDSTIGALPGPVSTLEPM